MFPSLFKDIVASDFQCEVCQFIEHCYTLFPINSIKCSKPFALIHFDIWEPLEIIYIHGARWFVTFINNNTRTTWLFLMKEKFEVSSLLPRFQKMIFTEFRETIKKVSIR